MNEVTTTHAPYCPLPITDKRRGYVTADKTDIRRTFEMHTPVYGDDYDLVNRQDWLDKGFKQ